MFEFLARGAPPLPSPPAPACGSPAGPTAERAPAYAVAALRVLDDGGLTGATFSEAGRRLTLRMAPGLSPNIPAGASRHRR